MMKMIDDVLGEPRHSCLLPSSEKMGHPLPKPGLVVHDQHEVKVDADRDGDNIDHAANLYTVWMKKMM